MATTGPVRPLQPLTSQAFAPVCYAGVERTRPTSGCLDALAPRKQAWERDNRSFLERASPGWFRMVREMREAGRRYGRDP